MAVCRKCGRDWPREYRVCPDDGTKLGSGADATQSVVGPVRKRESPVPAPSPSEESTTDLAAGTQVGEYVVEGKLGEGGMGAVYAARHPLIGKKAAIKVISPMLCADPAAVERFVQEARSVNQIGHPNIVDVFSFGELADRRSYFVMEWLAGESLGDRLSRGRLSLGECVDILEQVVDALEAAHETGIIHRDLKPDNVFLVAVRGNRQLVKLLDFGIAKLAGSGDVRVQRTRTGVMMGTPGYISPEQARGRNVDHRTDVYALGAMAFEMSCGRLPFDADNAMDIVMMHLTEPPPMPSSLLPEIPAALERILLKMLEKDPADRPPLSDVRAALQEVRGSELLASGHGDARAFSSGFAPRVQTPPVGVPVVTGAAHVATGTGAGAATGRAQGTRPPVERIQPAATSTVGPPRITALPADTASPVAGAAPVTVAPSTARGRGKWLVVAGVLVVLGGGAAAFLATQGGNKPDREPAPSAAATVTPTTPAPTPAPAAEATPPPAAATTPPPAPTSPVAAAATAPKPTGTIVIQVNVDDARIEVDGRVVAESANGARVSFEGDGSHEVVVTAPGRKPFKKTVKAIAGVDVEVVAKLDRASSTSRKTKSDKPARKCVDCPLDLDD